MLMMNIYVSHKTYGYRRLRCSYYETWEKVGSVRDICMGLGVGMWTLNIIC